MFFENEDRCFFKMVVKAALDCIHQKQNRMTHASGRTSNSIDIKTH